MTPQIVQHSWIGDLAVELSRGFDIFNGGTMYGVTVLTADGERTDMSKGGFTRAEALDYMESLQA